MKKCGTIFSLFSREKKRMLGILLSWHCSLKIRQQKREGRAKGDFQYRGKEVLPYTRDGRQRENKQRRKVEKCQLRLYTWIQQKVVLRALHSIPHHESAHLRAVLLRISFCLIQRCSHPVPLKVLFQNTISFHFYFTLGRYPRNDPSPYRLTGKNKTNQKKEMTKGKKYSLP